MGEPTMTETQAGTGGRQRILASSPPGARTGPERAGLPGELLRRRCVGFRLTYEADSAYFHCVFGSFYRTALRQRRLPAGSLSASLGAPVWVDERSNLTMERAMQLLQEGEHWTVETVVDFDEGQNSECLDVISLLPDALQRPILALWESDAPGPEVRRKTEVPFEARSLIHAVTDVRVPTFPDRSSQRPEAYHCLRRLRVALGKNCVVLLWGPRYEAYWDAQVLANSYIGVAPLDRVLREGSARREPARQRMADLGSHVLFTLEHLDAAVAAWATSLMIQVARTEDALDLDAHSELQRDLGRLGTAAAIFDQALRANKGRLREDWDDLPTPARDNWVGTLAEWEEELRQVQRDLSDGLMRLSTVAVGLQAHESARQNRTTASLQRTLTVLTGLILLPGMVLQVFSSNVRAFNTGGLVEGPVLAAWTVTPAALMIVYLSAGMGMLRGKPGLSLGLSLMLFAIVPALLLSPLESWMPVVLGGTLLAGIYLVSGTARELWARRRLRRRTSQHTAA